jgi:hypothetical protein
LAYGFTAAYAFAQVARILSLPLRSFGGALAGPVAAAAGMTAVLYAFKWAWELPTTTSGQLVWLAASVVVAVAAYAALLGLVARTTARELVHAVRVLRTRTVAAAPLDDAQLTPRVS